MPSQPDIFTLITYGHCIKCPVVLVDQSHKRDAKDTGIKATDQNRTIRPTHPAHVDAGRCCVVARP